MKMKFIENCKLALLPSEQQAQIRLKGTCTPQGVHIFRNVFESITGTLEKRELSPLEELDVAILAHKDSPLLGDQIAAWAEKHGLDKAAKAWEEWSGIPCACDFRRRLINKMDATVRSLFGRKA